MDERVNEKDYGCCSNSTNTCKLRSCDSYQLDFTNTRTHSSISYFSLLTPLLRGMFYAFGEKSNFYGKILSSFREKKQNPPPLALDFLFVEYSLQLNFIKFHGFSLTFRGREKNYLNYEYDNVRKLLPTIALLGKKRKLIHVKGRMTQFTQYFFYSFTFSFPYLSTHSQIF